VARRTRIGLLVLLRLFLFARKLTTPSARSIKYGFIEVTRMASHLGAIQLREPIARALESNNIFN
jgi:hypothetical protein